MTRSIPSIVVLALMSFTICYGLVRFPDAGILDAAPASSSVSSNAPQKVVAMRQTASGMDLQPTESSASVLPEIQGTSEELYVSGSSQNSADDSNGAANSNSTKKYVKNALKKNSRSKSVAGKKTAEAKKNPVDNASVADAPMDKPNDSSEKDVPNGSQLPALESASDEQADDPSKIIPLSDEDDDSIRDNSMPIPTDDDMLPEFDPFDLDIPPIQVPSTPDEPEQNIEPEQTQQELESEPEEDVDQVLLPESDQTAEDLFNEYMSENASSKSLTSNNDANASTDAASSSATENQTHSEPITIKSDPNAQEIPPRNRETKSANKDALTLPAVEEPQNAAPKSSIPSDAGTIPMETFPLDPASFQPVSYTESQEELYDPFGFHLPPTGQIMVKRLPSIENSVEPIYNNTQLDRFAL